MRGHLPRKSSTEDRRKSKYKGYRVKMDLVKDEKEGPMVEMNEAKEREVYDEVEKSGRSSLGRILWALGRGVLFTTALSGKP